MSIYEDLNYRLNENGIEHCFIDWSDWKEITDEKFHKLRNAYIKSRKDLQTHCDIIIKENTK